MVSNAYVEQRLQRMLLWMKPRGLQPVTVSVYLRCARLFLEHAKKPLRSVKQVDIEQYLLERTRFTPPRRRPLLAFAQPQAPADS